MWLCVATLTLHSAKPIAFGCIEISSVVSDLDSRRCYYDNRFIT